MNHSFQKLIKVASNIVIGVFFFGFIFGCQDDESHTCEQSSGIYQIGYNDADGLDKYDAISDYFEYLTRDSSFVVDIQTTAESNYLITADNGSSLCISDFFVNNYFIDTANLLVVFELNNRQPISTPYLIPITNLLFESLAINPYRVNPLCALWKIRLPVPATVHIKIMGKNGPDSDLNQSFGERSMAHDVPILGLYDNHENKVEVTLMSKYTSVIYHDTLIINIPAATTLTANINIIKHSPNKTVPGMNLVSARSHPGYDVPYMFDSYGELRWVLDYGTDSVLNRIFYDVGIERLKNGNWYFGDIRLDKIFEIGLLGDIVNVWDLGNYQFHHTVHEKDDGNFLVSVSDPGSLHLNGRPTLEDYIIEIDRQNREIIHEWDLKQSLDEYRTSLDNNLNNTWVDWIHVNSIYHDISDNSIIISGRYQGAIKISEDNRVKWILAPHLGWSSARNGDEMNDYLLTPLDQYGNPISDMRVLEGYENHPDFEWNWGQHAVQKTKAGRIILFDNGYRRNFGSTNVYSRVVEYEVDEVNMTVRQSWSFGKELGDQKFSSVASNVAYHPELDHFFMNGGFYVPTQENRGGVMMEIDRNSQAVQFEAEISPINGFAFHRMHRLSLYSKN